MGCPTNCRRDTGDAGPVLQRFVDNDAIKDELNTIDKRTSANLLRIRAEFGVVLGVLTTLGAWALGVSHRSTETTQLAAIAVTVGGIVTFFIFDLLFHNARRALIADIRERASATNQICVEARRRPGFQVSPAFLRSLALDFVWYAAVSGYSALVTTSCLGLAFDPTGAQLTASPAHAVSTAVVVANLWWLYVGRRVARGIFQLIMELKSNLAQQSQRAFRIQLLNSSRMRARTLEPRRSGVAGAAVAVSIAGMFTIGHPGEWLLPLIAVVLVTLDVIYWLAYKQSNQLAWRVHLEPSLPCSTAAQPHACPLRLRPSTESPSAPELARS